MKFIKIITILFITFTMTGVFAQSNSQMMKTRTTKSFEFKKDGKTIPYRITVFKTSKTPLVLKKEDKGELNQDRKSVPAYASKLIYVDNDLWSDYDKYIVVRYPKDANDSFELKATEGGFMMVVDKRNVEYIFGEGLYFVNNADKDFFFVDEFDSI